MLVNLQDVLKKAKQEHYAVGLFNTTDSDMLEAAIGAAEECASPIIIGTAEILLPYGELKLIAPGMIAAAKRASVPVVVHYDHGLTEERIREAIDLGFSSVMYDCSTLPFEENCAAVRDMVRYAHERGVSVEGELGHVGTNGDAAEEAQPDEERYTDPGKAKLFSEETGIDALAVAVGTAHGAYKAAPKLDFERLETIAHLLETPLVLHGGSGLSDTDFKTSIAKGIAKINIFTDLCLAGERALRQGIEEHKGYLELRNAKVAAVREAVIAKIRLFGSAGKA